MAATGASYKQIDYWCRCGLIEGQPGWAEGVGIGHRREWTDEQVRQVTLLVKASRLKSMPIEQLADVLAKDEAS